MGARNVSAAFTLWAHLDHAPFRLLVGMALQSLDQPSAEGRPARVYFGGEDALVELLGRSRSPVYKALRALKKEGAVDVIDVGRKGHRAVYKLALDPLAPPVRVSVTDTSKGVGNRRGKGVGNRDQRVAVNDTPRSTEEGTEESRPGETSPPAVVSPAPAPPVDNPGIEMSTEQANRELIKRQGLEHALRLLAQHAATHADCENPAGHLLAGPSLTVIHGGRSA
jgi:hypothetical protein